MFRISTCGAWFIAIATTFWTNCALAQITPDATLPNNSIINTNGKTFNITGGTQAGTNLFHSFQQFSVPTGAEALFNNTVDIQNIISRVTGGSISNIDGLIRTLGTANLFLINPNGIVFGPNARLDIGGSFIASTANSVNFADGTKFSASPSPDKPLLTITAPLGLNMGSNPGPILVQGPGHDINYEDFSKLGPRPPIDTTFTGLQVKEGQTLAFVGGNVSFEGGILKSPSGRIEIGSVGSNGAVSFVPIQQGLLLSYNAPSFGDIQFSQKTFVSTTGDGGGSIAMTGKNISLTGSSILQADTLGDRNGGEISFVGEKIVFNESNITANTYSSGNGGQINLVANNITFENQPREGGTLVSVGTQAWSKGDAGNINISASSFLLGNTNIVSNTEENSTGKAGDINIQVAGSMVVKSSGILSDTVTDNAGKVNISANSLQTDTSAVLSRTAKPGKVGEINIQVANSLEVRSTGIETKSFGNGDTGNINISANSFLLEESGINTYTGENSRGNAGDINIRVADSFIIKNTGILADTFESNAGNINISANSLQLEDSGVYSRTIYTGNAGDINIQVAGSFVSKGTTISTDSYGIGDGGKLNISANALQMDGSQIRSATGENATGNAGEINIRANRMELRNRSSVNTDISGKGNAGNISIVADTIKLDNESEINAKTTTGQGGNIGLEIGNLLLLRRASFISATAGTDQKGGDGGNITINARDGLIVAVPNENSDITANAFTGIGGQIEINTSGLFGIQPSFELTPNNDITAFSQSGISGEITINRPDVEQRLESVELPTVLADTSNVIDTSCASFGEGEGNSFTITGRGGLPPSPYEPLTTDVLWSDNRIPNIASQQRTEKPSTKPPSAYDVVKIVPATGWVFDGKGNVTLISHASNANLASSAACQKK